MDFGALLNQPPVTRAIIIGMCATAASVSFGDVAPLTLAFEPGPILAGELWRPLTSLLFFGKLNVRFVLRLMNFSTFSSWLESTYYDSAQKYGWALLGLATALLAVSSPLGVLFPSDAFLTSLMYLWSRLANNNRPAILWFFRVPMTYAMWYTLVITALIQPSAVGTQLLGIVLGHFLYFSYEVYPLWTGRSVFTADVE